MIRTLVVATIAAAALTTGPAIAAPDQPGTGRLAPCQSEGDNGCVWDARHMGNGIGHSYIATPDGHVIRVPHYVAHALINGGE
jgi:hypothetical protein